MQTNLKGLALAALVTFAGAGIASAQAPSQRNPNAPPSSPAPSTQSPSTQSPSTQSPPSSQAPSSREAQTTLSGELTRVNPDAKMFTVKNATGEIQFEYNDQTMVTGAQKSVAGLGTANGEQVTVTYRVDGTKNMATKIEVKDKK